MQIKQRQILDVLFFVVVGDLTRDNDNAHELLDTVRRAFEKGVKKIVLELSEVTRLDMEGLGSLAGSFQIADECKAALRFLNPSLPVRTRFETTKLDGKFRRYIFTDEEYAIDSFKIAISSRQIGHVRVLDIKGNLLLGYGCNLLKEEVELALAQDQKNIVLNMAEVPYVNSGGLGEIVRSHRTVGDHGGRLKLLHLTKRIVDLLSITKLLTVYETFEDEAEAVASFEPAPVPVGVSVLKIEGQLTLGDGEDALAAAVDGELNRGQTRLILNLSAVSSIDRAGIGQILRSSQKTNLVYGTLKVCGLKENIPDAELARRVLTSTGIEQFEDQNKAINSFQ